MQHAHQAKCQHAVDTVTALDYNPGHLDTAAAMCQALSDSARLRLLLWLAQREMCVSELVEFEQAKVSSISARLQTLYAARLVTRRREAKHIFYALADEHVHALLHNILGHATEAAGH